MCVSPLQVQRIFKSAMSRRLLCLDYSDFIFVKGGYSLVAIRVSYCFVYEFICMMCESEQDGLTEGMKII